MEDCLREIGMIARILDSIANVEFQELNLSKGQYVYLVRICENPGLNQRQVAEKVKIDETTCSRAIRNLEKNGYINRYTSEENKKNKLLYPTELGIQTYNVIKRENEYSLSKVLSEFNKEDINKLNKLLYIVRVNSEKEIEEVRKNGKRIY